MSELVDLTRDLVRVPSHEDEAAVGDRIEDWLRRETSAEVTRDDAGNVIARREHDRPTTIALVGHHDVVPPDETQVASETVDAAEETVDAAEETVDAAEETVDAAEETVDAADEYLIEEQDGRLYGRGTADMKGAVAAMLLAFRDADLQGTNHSLMFASFVGEEAGGEGARHAIDHGFSPDYAIVGEGSTGYSTPGVTDVAVAHKGRRGSTIVAEGSAAHASEPDAGENAVYRACDAVEVLRALPAPASSVLGHDVEGSLVVTGIDGGSAWNVVPERCEVTVDERTVPGDRADLARVESVAGVSWSVDQDLPPMACDDEAFADLVTDAARRTQSAGPEQVVKPHATDAGWLADAGVTCVVVGPAEPGEAHTADESVAIEVLERCRALYRVVAESTDDD